jgi:hypothetical protein
MAEEQKTEQETEQKPDPKPEQKPEERREERREDPPKNEAPPLVKCPECRVPIHPEDLGSHRYLAHKVERRTVKERKDDGDDQDDGAGSRTPKRKSTSQSDESDSQSGKKRGSRWDKVRQSW